MPGGRLLAKIVRGHPLSVPSEVAVQSLYDAPVRLDEYASLDAVGLAALVHQGEVTPVELAELVVEGTAKVDGDVNAVVGLYPDAVECAEAARPGPFHGVPTLLKDLFHGDPGRPTEAGSRLGHGWVSQTGSELVRRLKESGFVPLGRTTTSEFGLLGTTETIAEGRTCSPWSGKHMAGGSSGGAGAVVGSGIVPVATGSDGGGSIRIPAAACGVVGLKPTRGRVPWAPYAHEPLLGWGVQFVLARSVRDTAACLDVLSGPCPGDPWIAPAPTRPFVEEVGAPAGRLRIAYCFEPWSGRATIDEMRFACEATAQLLEELGHDVGEARPSFSWESFLGAMTVVWSTTTAQLVDGFAEAVGRIPGPDNLELPTLRMVELGRSVSAGQLLAALDAAGQIGRQMGSFFEEYDVLLTPTLGAPPARLGTYEPDAELEPRDLFDSWSQLESFLPVFNATGQPAISLPLYQGGTGLPIGMQLVGRFGDEATLLRLSAELEQALPWAGRVPPLHVAAP
jgi:amidase